MDDEGDAERLPVAMKFGTCGGNLHSEDRFCSSSGVALNMEAIAVKTYFCEGYEYQVILAFLAKYHHIEMSLRTLKNRFKSMGLS